MRYAAAFSALLLLSACGGTGSLAKQAEEVASVAAEGSLLAHDAAEDDTTATFTSVHAGELRAKAVAVAEHASQGRLARVAARVARDLAALSAEPTDRAAARRIERDLARAAEAASRIEKRA